MLNVNTAILMKNSKSRELYDIAQVTGWRKVRLLLQQDICRYPIRIQAEAMTIGWTQVVRVMHDCPFNPDHSPCELKMDLMILQETEQESLEIFYAMREELRLYMRRTQLLGTILAENGIPIPEYDD